MLAAQKITSADISGAELGSQNLRFLPKEIQGGIYSFDVSEKKGSAGSVTLVLQTIFLPLSLAIRRSKIGIIGGTHVPWSPPFQYLDHIFLPAVKRIGLDIRLTLERWGFYPKGGGKVEAEILPAPDGLRQRGAEEHRPVSFSTIDIKERGGLKRIWGVSATSNLPKSIAERQRDSAITILKNRGFAPQIDIVEAPSIGQGTFLILITEFENSIAGFSSLGARGKRAEKVGEEAATAFLDFYQSGAALDPYLADQLLPYLAIAKGESIITTSRISRHLLTNIRVIEQFLPVKFIVEGKEGESGKITVSG